SERFLRAMPTSWSLPSSHLNERARAMSDTIYTIGHSTHSIEHIISLLKKSSITAVCDVRSKPYSRTNPQFNRDVISIALRNAGIVYVFLGEELGARTHDKNCYCDGQVQYDRLAKTDFFERGLRRVRDGARSYRLALMCAEKEPLECHRTILVSRSLVERGMCVRHILSDGRLEEHEQTLER